MSLSLPLPEQGCPVRLPRGEDTHQLPSARRGQCALTSVSVPY